MATFKHNKKKNLLLLWEFFSYYMADAILENKNVESAKNVVSKYLFANKQLKTEFELVKSLLEIKGLKSPDVAAKTLRKLEEVAKQINLEECEGAKNKLLAELARIDDSKFYSRKINSEFFRNAALAHTLVSYWAGLPGVSLLEAARLEDHFIENFQNVPEEKVLKEDLLELEKEDIDNLVVHVMNKKFNDIYMKEFNDIQRAILKEWVFVQDKPDVNLDGEISFADKLKMIREETKSFLTNTKKDAMDKHQESFVAVLDEALAKIVEADNKPIDDNLVALHLSLVEMIIDIKNSSKQEGA